MTEGKVRIVGADSERPVIEVDLGLCPEEAARAFREAWTKAIASGVVMLRHCGQTITLDGKAAAPVDPTAGIFQRDIKQVRNRGRVTVADGAAQQYLYRRGK